MQLNSGSSISRYFDRLRTYLVRYLLLIGMVVDSMGISWSSNKASRQTLKFSVITASSKCRKTCSLQCITIASMW